MTDEERIESRRLLSVLDAARREFGPEALRRLEGSIRAAAGVEPMADTGDPLRRPDGLYIPGLKSAAWHARDWMPDTALLEAAAPAIRAELESLLSRRGSSAGEPPTGSPEPPPVFQPFDEGEYGFNPANTDGQWNVYYVVLGSGVVPSAAA